MRGTWVIVVLVVAASAVGAATQADGNDCPVDVGESDEPGQELANVVGAQEIVVARELERRGFNATLENASGSDERATVVATELERIDARLASLETCRDALVEARETGDLAANEYRQRAATLEPEIEDVRERLNRTEAAAADLPPEVREENDIDEERFDEMEEQVDDLESFVARPGRAIESADGNENDGTPTGPQGESAAGSSPPTQTGPADAPGQATETPTTENPDDENEKGEKEKGKNGDEASKPGKSDEAGANYG
jgi:hypothetical protein